MPRFIVTGARGGVASAIRIRLQQRGDSAILVSRDPSALDPAASEAVLAADCVQPESVGAIVRGCAEFDDIRGLVHCVGSTLIASPARTSTAQWREVIAVNLHSAFHAAQAAFELFDKSGQGGSLVLFSSVVARIGVVNHAAIAAAKAGVEGLCRSLAADGAARRIRVNCIAPGLLRSPMTERIVASARGAEQVAAQYPLGRFGVADEAAALACWLLGEESDWINGQVIGLDGGFSAVRPFVKA